MTTRRLRDQHGHLWPITGHRCPICRMPADPSLDDGPHPMCLPPATPDQDTLTAAVELLAQALGAEPIGHFHTRWPRTGQPLPDPTTAPPSKGRSA